MASGADFTVLHVLYFGRTRDVLSVLPYLTLPCHVYASALEQILQRYVDCNWQKVSIGVKPDGKQTWIADPSVRRVFVWCRHFLFNTSCNGVLLPCVSFLKIPQNVCKSRWWRQNEIVFAWKMDTCVCSKHLNKFTCIFVCAGQVYLCIWNSMLTQNKQCPFSFSWFL